MIPVVNSDGSWWLVKHYCIPYSRKVWWGESLANWLFSSIWRKKVWRINRSANRLSIISTKLGGFSLANHGWIAKFAKLSRYTVLSLLYTSLYHCTIGSRKRAHQIVIGPHSTKLLETMFAPSVYSRPGI